MFKKSCWAVLTLLVTASAATVAQAQGLETLGSRAPALAAFVAVADDASAVVWNPAGLIVGPIFNLSIDLGRSTVTPDGAPQPFQQAGQTHSTLVALGVPQLGLSYYRVRSIAVSAAGTAESETADRQDNQVIVRTLVTNHLGATVMQSLGRYVTVGATAKLVRGGVGMVVESAGSWDEAFDRSDTSESRDSTFDLDVGAMFAAGRLRAGVVARNVTEPTFEAEAGDVELSASLERHVRAGVAWGAGWPGLTNTIVAFDADLTHVPHPAGERRDVAAGVEQWIRGRLVGLRGGLRASTIGDARPVFSVGGSYAVRAGTFVDAYVVRGTKDDRGWGIAARLTY